MKHRILPLLFLVLGCKGQTEPVETDTDTDTDADSDTDADADVDVLDACLGSIDVNAGLAGAVGFDTTRTYEWDQGWGVSVCFVPGSPGEGAANAYMRVADGGPGDAYCAATYAVTSTPLTTCDACDVAMSLSLVETSSIDVLTPIGDANCSYLAEVQIPAFGVEVDPIGNVVYSEDAGVWSAVLDGESSVDVTEVGGATRVDWLWKEFRSLD